MTNRIGTASRNRSRFDRVALGAAIAFGITLISSASALAKAQVEGAREAVRVAAESSSIEEILAALGATFELRYRSSTNLAKQLSGTYQGSLERVVRRVLEGYDFVLKSENGKLDVTVLGPRNAAAVMAATSPASTQPAPSSARAPALAPVNATGSPAAAPMPDFEHAPALKVAEGPAALPSDVGAELSETPGVNPSSPLALSKIPGMRPALESALGGQPRL
jgi:hypothetical protein